MTINYSKASLFLVAFLVWNIVSPFFIEYRMPNFLGGPFEKGFGPPYFSLWFYWLFAFLLVTILYFIDRRRGKTKSTAYLLKSYFLAVVSYYLMGLLLSVTTGVFENYTSAKLLTPLFGPPVVLFIWTPLYFFILKSKYTLKQKKMIIFLPFLVTYFLIVALYLPIYFEYKNSPNLIPDTKSLFHKQK